MRRIRVSVAAVVMGISASACGGTVDAFDDTADRPIPAVEVVTTTEANTGRSEQVETLATPTASLSVSVAALPADPFETYVADIVEEVEILETFDAPGGVPVEFEYAITNPTYFGHPLSLMVVNRVDDDQWLKVQIPVRPNGTEAWIRGGDATLRTHRYHAQVDLSDRSVTVWDGDELVVETGAVVGKDRTPTPLGRFFVNDLVEKWDGSAYGPYILSLSAFSEALDSFGGGVPVIAIHGTNDPGLIGGAFSNGCIRIPNDAIRVLADNVPMGTPVDIVA